MHLFKGMFRIITKILGLKRNPLPATQRVLRGDYEKILSSLVQVMYLSYTEIVIAFC